MKKFKNLLEKQHELSLEMNRELVRFVSEHGGFINIFEDEHKDTLYGYVFDDETTLEEKISAVRVENNILFVKFDSGWYSRLERF